MLKILVLHFIKLISRVLTNSSTFRTNNCYKIYAFLRKLKISPLFIKYLKSFFEKIQ